ncbi:MAG: transcription termination/antitermination protein NusA [Clostridia bacterium]|nr:transcription termination/antitermination protein NusA [Clostridia bacterium]
MNAEFFNALDLLEKEKGIPKDYMLEKVEAALVSAFKKECGSSENVRIVLDPVKKDVRVYQQKTVVETVEDPLTEISLEEAKALSRRHKLGGVVEFELKPKSFRRLSAGAAKQVIIQGIREAERARDIREYENRKEEVMTARVYKIDDTNGNVILELGKGTVVLPKNEQLPTDRFKVGDYVKVVVTEINTTSERGQIVTISRTHSGLIKRLFEEEVPEIRDGTVIIKAVAREAGVRSKIAVLSRDENVDPVGACIGAHGMRIGNVMNECRGEKIDVIPYSEDICEFVKAALSPAEVISVEKVSDRACEVKVAPEQLSLAIGREGINAKLAARLTYMKIDIKA